MLRWKPRQLAMLVTVLPALANLGFAALVFGQLISGRPVSRWLIAMGVTQWVILVSVSFAIAGVDE